MEKKNPNMVHNLQVSLHFDLTAVENDPWPLNQMKGARRRTRLSCWGGTSWGAAPDVLDVVRRGWVG